MAFFHSYKSIAASLLVVLATSACSLINEEFEPQPEPTEPRTVKLSFAIGTHAPSSRADSDPSHTEIGEAAMYESMIDIAFNDYQTLIFDGSDDNARLIFSSSHFTGSGTAATNDGYWPSDANYRISGLEGTYTATVDAKVLAPGGGQRTFTIMIVANLYGVGSDYSFSYSFGETTTFAQARQALSTVEFQLNQTVGSGTSVSEPNWQLGKTLNSTNPLRNGSRCLIPMFGCKSFTFTLPTTDENAYIDLGQVSMLRALAKFEFVDLMPKDADGYPRITQVRFTGNASTQGFFLRNARVMPAWESFADGMQMTAPTLPSNRTRLTSATAIKHSGPLAPPLEPANPGKTYDYWTAYSTEMPFNDTKVVAVTLETAAGTSETKSVYVSGGESGVDFTGNVLRNHVYRIGAEQMRTATISLQYLVCPFEKYDVDVPTFE